MKSRPYANDDLRRAIRGQRFVMYAAWLAAVLTLITILMPAVWGPFSTLFNGLWWTAVISVVTSVGYVAWHTFRGACQTRGGGYATIHLILLLALSVLFLLGAFVIPLLVNGDGLRDQRSDAEQLTAESRMKATGE